MSTLQFCKVKRTDVLKCFTRFTNGDNLDSFGGISPMGELRHKRPVLSDLELKRMGVLPRQVTLF